MEKTKIDYRYQATVVAIGIILTVAAYVRLNNIREYMVFLGDQGRDVLIVMRMLKEKDFVFIGPTASVGGFFLGPFYYYLITPALLLANFDPVGPAILVALLSIATTYLIFYFAKTYLNITAAITASLLFAVSKLVVEYARSSWNPNVLPFFTMALIIALAKVLEGKTHKKNIWLFIIGSCMGIIIQLHYQAVVMNLCALTVLLLYFWREYGASLRTSYKQIAKETGILIVGAFLFLAPFIMFEIYHSFPNTQNIVRFVFHNQGESFSGGQSYEFIVRDTIYRLFLRLLAAGNDTVTKITIIITMIGFACAIYKGISSCHKFILSNQKPQSFEKDMIAYIIAQSKNKKSIGFVLITMYFMFGVALWGFYKKSIHDYYYSYMYQVPILMFAAALAVIRSYKEKISNVTRATTMAQLVTSVSLITIVTIVVILNIQAINAILPGRQVWRTEQVADAILQHKAQGKYNFALITPGNSDHAYRYFLELKGEKPTPLEEEVTTQLMVFCEVNTPKPCEPQGHPLWEIAGFGQAGIVGQWEVIGLPLFRLEHIPETKHLEGKPARKG